jgi:hypothetical protein
MKVVTINGQQYKLPNELNAFQQEMYVHLINWKWKYITREPGRDGDLEYDAILPDKGTDEFPTLYTGLQEVLQQHRERFPFRIHKYFMHMASSQAANINLFLPVLRHPQASAILGKLNPDLARIDPSQLDNGYRIEFWDEPFGNLGDKTDVSGTDADIAIAYHNHQGELCLWLIEHKLTEREFTECGGARSKGRQSQHDCGKSFAEIVSSKGSCYYHDVRKFNYWRLTEANQAFFANHADHAGCPFRGGMNQLWRNQLLALSIQQDQRQPFKHVSFSVVKHPGNHHLDATLAAYKRLIADNGSFSAFTSADVLAATAGVGDVALAKWVTWYRELYNL